MSVIIMNNKVYESDARYFFENEKKIGTLKGLSENKIQVVFNGTTKELDSSTGISPIYTVKNPDCCFDLLTYQLSQKMRITEKKFHNNGWVKPENPLNPVIVGEDGNEITPVEDSSVWIPDKGQEVSLAKVVSFDKYDDRKIFVIYDEKQDKYCGFSEEGLEEVSPIENAIATKIAIAEGKWDYNAVKQAREEEIKVLLSEYDHAVTEKGISKNCDIWAENKSNIIKIFSNHPNWDEKKQMIVFDSEYDLQKNPKEIKKFFEIMMDKAKLLLVPEMIEYKGEKYTYSQLKDLYNLICLIEQFLVDNDNCIFSTVNKDFFAGKIAFSFAGSSAENLVSEKSAIYGLRGGFTSEWTDESLSIMSHVSNFCCYMAGITNDTVTEEMKGKLDSKFPELRVHMGQKTSRVVRKFFDQYPIITSETEKHSVRESVEQADGHVEHVETEKSFNVFEKYFAAYSDAINPKKVSRTTVISLNPIDYLTMSFGTNWSSCHTIDQTNKRGIDLSHDYHGAYCAGCASYMDDSTTVLMYTIDKKYTGKDVELQPKIQRCAFMIGTDMFMQSRLYPDGRSNGGMTSIATQFRDIFQKVLSECIKVDKDAWDNRTGTSICNKFCVVGDHAKNYPDFQNYNDCNMSFLKYSDGTTAESKSYDKIVVGHESYYMDTAKINRTENHLSEEEV